MSVFKDIIKKQEEDFYLRKTTYLSHIPEQNLRKELVSLYNSSDELAKALGTILNAIYTDGKPTFYLSMRSLAQLLSEDKNLSYKGRTGIPTTNYRTIYAKLFTYFATDSTFTLIAKADKLTKTPACVQLHDENTLLSMGNQMIIKLASNWHQMAIKQLSNLSKCHDNTDESGKVQHDYVNTTLTLTPTTRKLGAKAPKNSEEENIKNFRNSEQTPEEIKLLLKETLSDIGVPHGF